MLKVCKFGGSSVAGAGQFQKVRDIIEADTTLYAKWGQKAYRVTVAIMDESGAVRSVSLSDNGGDALQDAGDGSYRLTIGAYHLNLNIYGQEPLSHSFSIPGEG